MARTPKSSYEVRRGSDGKTGIYLRGYNVRCATFNANQAELIDLLSKMFDDANAARKRRDRITKIAGGKINILEATVAAPRRFNQEG